jgi:hypothetical protein
VKNFSKVMKASANKNTGRHSVSVIKNGSLAQGFGKLIFIKYPTYSMVIVESTIDGALS